MYEPLFGKPKKKKKSKFEDLNPTNLDPKWRTYNIINMMCKELNYKPNEVYELNYISVLNWLSYFKESAEIQKNQMNNSNV